ncbi:MAG: hypothetical protein WD830_12450 [Chloroflexota bacterium]
MIVYVDSSVLARAYLSDEAGHDEAVALLEDAGIALVTGTWSRIDEDGLLELLDADLGPGGAVTVVAAAQDDVEARALPLVRAATSSLRMTSFFATAMSPRFPIDQVPD